MTSEIRKKNESAFPGYKNGPMGSVAVKSEGLTKRELVAVMILSGSMGNDQYVAAFADQVKGDPHRLARILSTQSIILADALIAELERKEE